MTTAKVVETSVTVNNNSPIQDHVHPDDQTQPTCEMTPGLKPFRVIITLQIRGVRSMGRGVGWWVVSGSGKWVQNLMGV